MTKLFQAKFLILAILFSSISSLVKSETLSNFTKCDLSSNFWDNCIGTKEIKFEPWWGYYPKKYTAYYTGPFKNNKLFGEGYIEARETSNDLDPSFFFTETVDGQSCGNQSVNIRSVSNMKRMKAQGYFCYGGRGTIMYEDGLKMIGTFKEVRKKYNYSSFLGNGYLEVHFPNGNKYIGNVVNGHLEGKGILITKKYKYIGNFLEDKFNGFGEIIYNNGDKFSGVFIDGFFNLNEMVYQGNIENEPKSLVIIDACKQIQKVYEKEIFEQCFSELEKNKDSLILQNIVRQDEILNIYDDIDDYINSDELQSTNIQPDKYSNNFVDHARENANVNSLNSGQGFGSFIEALLKLGIIVGGAYLLGTSISSLSNTAIPPSTTIINKIKPNNSLIYGPYDTPFGY